MAQRQRYDSHGNGYSGFGTQGHGTGDFFQGHEPYYSPERDRIYGNEPKITSFAYTHLETYTARHSTRGDASNVQPGLEINPPDKPYFAATPELLEKDNASSRNILPEDIANSYDPIGGPSQQYIHRRSQEEIISDIARPECQPSRQSYSDSTIPYHSNMDWIPNEPSERMPTSFDSPSNFRYTASTTVCASCRNYTRINSDQTHFFGPSEKNFQSTGRQPAEETRHDIPYIVDLGVPGLEQPTGLNFRNPNAICALVNPVIVRLDNDSTKKGPTKKRKRKPRIAKPRKPRTLTEEGKAHAKAVRKCPEGACKDCKRRKTKARDPTMTNLVSTRL